MAVRDIWKKGIPLAEADYYFAPQKLRDEYNEPQIPPRRMSRGLELMMKEMPADRRSELLKQIEPVQTFFDVATARSDVQRRMRDRLLHLLSIDRLVAYGFPIPRNPADSHQRISQDLFQSRFVNWDHSSIKGAGLEFQSVLVVRPKLAAEIEARLPQVARRAIGRPSSRGAITAAIRSLIDADWSPAGLRKRDYDSIRAQVHKLFPGQFAENKNLSDKTIAKYLRSEIARFRPAKRPSPKP